MVFLRLSYLWAVVAGNDTSAYIELNAVLREELVAAQAERESM